MRKGEPRSSGVFSLEYLNLQRVKRKRAEHSAIGRLAADFLNQQPVRRAKAFTNVRQANGTVVVGHRTKSVRSHRLDRGLLKIGNGGLTLSLWIHYLRSDIRDTRSLRVKAQP